MVLFNYAIREITAKIVYYGPGLGGKTTNLQKIHEGLNPKTRGKLISLATDADRTLFFDFLPLDLGNIGGFKLRFQLYTVPGQVHYNATRRLVLKGVDAVIFVADSQIEMMERNRESYENLKENLSENGYDYTTIPTVFQFNKQDLPNVATPAELAHSMGLELTDIHWFEGVAVNGKGVQETLKAIIKLGIARLKGQFEEGAPSPVTRPRTKAAEPVAPPPIIAPPPVAEEEPVVEPTTAPWPVPEEEPRLLSAAAPAPPPLPVIEEPPEPADELGDLEDFEENAKPGEELEAAEELEELEELAEDAGMQAIEELPELDESLSAEPVAAGEEPLAGEEVTEVLAPEPAKEEEISFDSLLGEAPPRAAEKPPEMLPAGKLDIWPVVDESILFPSDAAPRRAELPPPEEDESGSDEIDLASMTDGEGGRKEAATAEAVPEPVEAEDWDAGETVAVVEAGEDGEAVEGDEAGSTEVPAIPFLAPVEELPSGNYFAEELAAARELEEHQAVGRREAGEAGEEIFTIGGGSKIPEETEAVGGLDDFSGSEIAGGAAETVPEETPDEAVFAPVAAAAAFPDNVLDAIVEMPGAVPATAEVAEMPEPPEPPEGASEDMAGLAEPLALPGDAAARLSRMERELVEIRALLEENRRLMNKVIDLAVGSMFRGGQGASPERDRPEPSPAGPRRGWLARFFLGEPPREGM